MRAIALSLCFALASVVGSSAHATTAGRASLESRVVAALAQRGVRAKGSQISIRGMGVREPGLPTSGATKTWSAYVDGRRYSGRITFTSAGTPQVRVNR